MKMLSMCPQRGGGVAYSGMVRGLWENNKFWNVFLKSEIRPQLLRCIFCIVVLSVLIKSFFFIHKSLSLVSWIEYILMYWGKDLHANEPLQPFYLWEGKNKVGIFKDENFHPNCEYFLSFSNSFVLTLHR